MDNKISATSLPSSSPVLPLPLKPRLIRTAMPTALDDSAPIVDRDATPPEPESETDPTLSESEYDSDSDSDEESSSDEDEDEEKKKAALEEPLVYRRDDYPDEDDDSPEANIRRFRDVLESKRMKRRQEEEERGYESQEELFNFPEDPEKWREEDLKELWADAPLEMTKPGWDPAWVDEEDIEVMREEVAAGRDPPIAPFYLPYRKPYPPIPDEHHDISNPKAVVHELDRIEEFLQWVSYIFPDGSWYEGTVWDDLAHGKGVYEAEQGLVRYEGEWLQNNQEGHGVIEVDIPDIQPIPGSKLEAKMRAEGKIITRDFMSPEDREWLEMDIEDSVRLSEGRYEIPFYENDEWIRQFGEKPEKGRYRYAGQWKHGRMHGCGVYELNERVLYGRFYFGKFVGQDVDGCDVNICAMHSGIADVAAAKARMFLRKPDGMVREAWGPYGDPQHPYFYEEGDVWMAPGFINQFYEVPDFWKIYVHEVDQEREMWLNSFYKAPLRLPMPSELEYWWSKNHDPEFVLINKEREPDPNDPSKLIYTEAPLILHVPSGRIINYIEDEKHGIRLFWQPPLKEGEELDLSKVEFLPLGFDEFYGEEASDEKGGLWNRLVKSVENMCKPVVEKIEKWAEEKKKNSEMKAKLIEQQLELVEAEICLEEAIEELDEELKLKEKEEQRKTEMGLSEEDEIDDTAKEIPTTLIAEENRKALEQKEEEDDDDGDDDEPDDGASSFGTTALSQDGREGKRGSSPFSAISLSVTPCILVSCVAAHLARSALPWKGSESPAESAAALSGHALGGHGRAPHNVNFRPNICGKGCLRAVRPELHQHLTRTTPSRGSASQLHSLSRTLSRKHSASSKQTNSAMVRGGNPFPLPESLEGELSRILSLQNPLLSSYWHPEPLGK